MKKQMILICMLIGLLLLSSCGASKEGIKPTVGLENTTNTFEQISQEEAKRIMDVESGYIILDVREQDEYDGGHIPGAVLMPYEQAAELADELLSDKDQQILIYCRSGRRSKIAAQTLADLGYTIIKEFGGIIDWEYEIE